MDDKHWPKGHGFESTRGLSKRVIEREGEELILCTIFPSNIEYQYPKEAKLPFLVIKKSGSRNSTLLFSDDGAAWHRLRAPAEEHLIALKRLGCTVYLDTRRERAHH
jgi:hypothetical protein